MKHHRTGLNRYGEEVSEVRQSRLIVLLTSEEMAALDEYQFRNRIPTRSKAARDIIASVTLTPLGRGEAENG